MNTDLQLLRPSGSLGSTKLHVKVMLNMVPVRASAILVRYLWCQPKNLPLSDQERNLYATPAYCVSGTGEVGLESHSGLFP